MTLARQKISIFLLQLCEKYCIIIKCGSEGWSAPVMEQYRSGHNGHDWKSCDGRKPSVSSNLTCSANGKRPPIREVFCCYDEAPLLIHLFLEHAYVGQVAVMARIVKAVAHHELIGYVEADGVRAGAAAVAGLIEKAYRLHGGGLP